MRERGAHVDKDVLVCAYTSVYVHRCVCVSVCMHICGCVCVLEQLQLMAAREHAGKGACSIHTEPIAAQPTSSIHSVLVTYV